MKIGPDGIMPRITSSAEQFCCNLRIIKSQEDQIKHGGPFKLVWVGPGESESESENSEGWWTDEDIPNVQKLVEIAEVAKDNGMQTEDAVQLNESQNTQTNKNHIVRNSRNRGFHNYKNFKSATRNFSSSRKTHNNYNNSNTPIQDNRGFSRNFDDVSPWVVPPPVIQGQGLSFVQYSHIPYVSSLEHHEQTPPLNPSSENPVMAHNRHFNYGSPIEHIQQNSTPNFSSENPHMPHATIGQHYNYGPTIEHIERTPPPNSNSEISSVGLLGPCPRSFSVDYQHGQNHYDNVYHHSNNYRRADETRAPRGGRGHAPRAGRGYAPRSDRGHAPRSDRDHTSRSDWDHPSMATSSNQGNDFYSRRGNYSQGNNKWNRKRNNPKFWVEKRRNVNGQFNNYRP